MMRRTPALRALHAPSLLNDLKTYGFISTLKKIFRLRESWFEKKHRKFVGMDKYGNKYFESDDAMPTRNRWVEYNKFKGYDASEIPAEWHMWLHKSRKDPPAPDEGEDHICTVEHTRNLTGRIGKYYPPGHFLNPAHRNPMNAHKCTSWNPNKEEEPIPTPDSHFPERSYDTGVPK